MEHLHQVERDGESEWTPWIAIAGLILFFAAIGLLVFGVVEAASHLLASGTPEGCDLCLVRGATGEAMSPPTFQ